MSQQLTRGPLPASVYWRRRAYALLTVCAVVSLVAGVTRSVTGGEDERAQVSLSGAATSAAEPTADSTAGPTAGTTDDAPTSSLPTDDAADAAGQSGAQGKGKGKGRKGKGAKTAPALPEPQGSCLEQDVLVRPEVSSAVAGRPVTVTLRLRTRMAEACTWELSPKTFTWKITSGPDEIWTSRECPRAVPTRELVVRRDTETTADLVWGGRRSDAECSRLTEWALPGWYHATVAPLAGEPKDTQFELASPTPATVTASPQPRRKRADR